MSEARMMVEFEDEEREQEGFKVWDDAGAKWCVDKIREAEAECDRMISWYAAQIERAKARCAATVERMTGYLRDYAEEVPMKETKTQRSYPVPGGKLVLKKATTKLEHDDETLLRALKETGRTEFIKTVVTEKVDWAGLKKELNETGEIIEGVTRVEVPESFEVKVEG